jgi:hypothetical protein
MTGLIKNKAKIETSGYLKCRVLIAIRDADLHINTWPRNVSLA